MQFLKEGYTENIPGKMRVSPGTEGAFLTNLGLKGIITNYFNDHALNIVIYAGYLLGIGSLNFRDSL